MNRNSVNSRGFSLTELLVAMVIGLLLLAGLVTLMVNSKKNYAQQDYSARLQENARFAVEFLSYDIRMAGFYGCSNEIINDNTVTPISATDSGNGNPDSLTVTHGEPYEPGQEVLLDAAAAADATTLSLNDVPTDWSDTDTLLVGDCGSTAVADITSGGINTGTDEVTVAPRNGSFRRVFNPAAEDSGPITVRRLVSNEYCIEIGESQVPTLYRESDPTSACSAASPELVEGVENIQLLYQSLAGGNFVIGSGSLPANLAAVQFAALVRSVSNENLDNREYGSGADITENHGPGEPLLDQDVSAVTGTIRGQRRVFNSTLAVRNRSL
ncbi:MAG: prepilin-type N-terminal cleavage/methylation domain-containing protein [Gammaproteobacteria bacterium]|nr:prepilin-type N-terminal cleavage/methylation domain-containing protein [Gammaproteobacteria bacterium]